MAEIQTWKRKIKGHYKYGVGTREFPTEAGANQHYMDLLNKAEKFQVSDPNTGLVHKFDTEDQANNYIKIQTAKLEKEKNKPEKLSFPNPVTGKTETALDSSALIKQLGHITTQDSITQVKYIDDWLKQLSQLRLRESEFEQKGDATSLKVTRKRIKDVESKINELDTTSTDEVPVKNGKEKSGYFDSFKKSVSEWWSGSEEAQSKKAWIENYAEQEKEVFVNRELEVPPEFKSNPEKWYNKENKKRTNQWYAKRAEEAYAEEMKIKDPAGIVGYIK